MKPVIKLCSIITLSLTILGVYSQHTFYNTGADVYIGNSSIVHVNGSVYNDGTSGQLTNEGELYIRDNSLITPDKAGNFSIIDGEVKGNGTYYLEGDWTNHAIFYKDLSEVILDGDTQNIQGSIPTNYYDLTLTGTGNGAKHLKIDATSSGILALNDKELYTETNTFHVLNTDTGAITKTLGHVSSDNMGYLRRLMDISLPYHYPLGEPYGSFYRPIEITPNSLSSGNQAYNARLAHVLPTTEGFDVTNTGKDICTVNNEYYHQIERAVGSNSSDVTIYFDDATDFYYGVVAHYQKEWEDVGPVSDYINPTGLSHVTVANWNDFDTIAWALASPGLDLNGSKNDLACNNDSSGSIQVTPVGGVGTIDVTWTPSTYTGTTLTGLGAGTYIAAGLDTFGCEQIDTFLVVEPPPIAIDTGYTDVQCNGDSTGMASVSVTGGTSPFSYLWSSNAGSATSSTVTGLPSGIYTVTVTDDNGCIDTSEIQLTEPSAINGFANGTMPSCNGDSTGSASIVLMGGTSPYTYQWGASTGFQTGQTAISLPAGVYTVTTTDDALCEKVFTVAVSEPPALVSTTDSTSEGCGMDNGEATVAPSGGSPGYTYQWSDPSSQTTPTAIGLEGGWYFVTVLDVNLCEHIDSVHVPIDYSVGGPPITPLTNDPTCNTYNDGMATVDIAGGLPPFTYSWSTGTTADTAKPLAPGNYYVTVTDANDCYTIDTVTIDETPRLNPNISGNDTLCSAEEIWLAATDTFTTYIWNTGETTDSILISPVFIDSGLTVYSVTVSDGTCYDSIDFDITILDLPTVRIEGPDQVCDSTDFELDAISDALYYSWSTGDSTSTIFPNSANGITQYNITVTDAHGCTGTLSEPYDIFIMPLPTAGFITEETQFMDMIQFYDSSSSDVIAWNWEMGDGNTSTLEDPRHTYDPGLYEVMMIVENGYGCFDTAYGEVDIEEGMIIPNVFSPNGDGYNDEFLIPTSGVDEFELEIFNRWGMSLFKTTSSRVAWPGKTMSGDDVPPGTYYFILRAVSSEKTEITGYLTLVRN